MTIERLLARAAALGVTVEWRALGPCRGDYCDDLRLIRINKNLTHAQQVETLSHELGHAIHRDRHTSPGIERRASITGAGLALTAEEYRRAEAIAGPHAGALAVELGVTARLVLHWRAWYDQVRTTITCCPRECTHGMD